MFYLHFIEHIKLSGGITVLNKVTQTIGYEVTGLSHKMMIRITKILKGE